MNTDISANDPKKCQVFSLDRLAEPGRDTEAVKLTLRNHLRLILRRSFSPSVKRKVKKYSSVAATFLYRLFNNNKSLSTDANYTPHLKFEQGDLVLIQSEDKIKLTLNYWNELKGCGFLPEMWQYCGTVQRVLKPVSRFVDERDSRVKKVRGIYILEGVNCQGFELYGRCDRNCFYFWREEWLTKIDVPEEMDDGNNSTSE